MSLRVTHTTLYNSEVKCHNIRFGFYSVDHVLSALTGVYLTSYYELACGEEWR